MAAWGIVYLVERSFALAPRYAHGRASKYKLKSMIVITRLLFIVVVMYALPVQSPLIQRQQRIVVLLPKQFPSLIQRRFAAHILQPRIGPFPCEDLKHARVA